jgi:hypothetical protein
MAGFGNVQASLHLIKKSRGEVYGFLAAEFVFACWIFACVAIKVFWLRLQGQGCG